MITRRKPTAGHGAVGVIHQRGVTLIELMVSLVIGLILSAGVIQIFLGSNQAYRFQEELSRIQENGRFAIGTISRYLRETDYWGCVGQALDSGRFTDLSDGGGETFELTNSVRGFTNNDTGWTPGLDEEVSAENPDPAGDVIRLRSLAFGDSADVSERQSSGSNLFVDYVKPFSRGDTVLATNCSQAVQFDINNTPTANENNPGGQLTVPSNPQFYETYTPTALHGGFGSVYFFLGDDGQGGLALNRMRGGVAQKLVDGIERMVFDFGVDTNGDRRVDVYRTANNVGGDWEDVLVVRVSLLLRGREDHVTEDAQVLAFPPGGTFTAPDNRLRQVFTTTVSLRNRLQ